MVGQSGLFIVGLIKESSYPMLIYRYPVSIIFNLVAQDLLSRSSARYFKDIHLPPIY